ncbi:hypothetical protein [Parvularcula sp. LCG005]|uniref:hypothetical protein n=1 Tax=Parvularcula sp. LCG005 TaxID=3078805 RepID=UPI0029430193|nr:hypothetical protein [Parvularcula sp. LCG005]WOI54673.1 hypothetical protein RUI03_06640 [Parvularcula sp. LCG005]
MPISKKNLTTLGAATIALGGLAIGGSAQAAHLITYNYTLSELNDSGVSGGGTLVYNKNTNELTVNLMAMGLAEQRHIMHIHGALDADGNPVESIEPDASFDADGDGYIEVLEAVGAYGDVMRSLTMGPSDLGATEDQYMFAADGVLNYSVTFDLDTDPLFSPVTGTTYSLAQFLPLAMREIVIHGGIVPAGAGAGTDGEVNGTGGYVSILPVAVAALDPVPIPAAALLFATAGLGGVGVRMRKKKQQSA